jgi:hypothetical protein
MLAIQTIRGERELRFIGLQQLNQIDTPNTGMGKPDYGTSGHDREA